MINTCTKFEFNPSTSWGSYARHRHNLLHGAQSTTDIKRWHKHTTGELTRFKYIEGQLARWLEELSQYNFQQLHRPGAKHQNADCLSQIPDSIPLCHQYKPGVKVAKLPCGGCAYCTRAHTHWERFNEDVDDIVPLSLYPSIHLPKSSHKSNQSLMPRR